ncbi:MAG: S49 family peptidase [Calditrichota bacterium]
MRKLALITLWGIILAIPSGLQAEAFFLPQYYPQSDFLGTTPSVSGDAAGAFFNPAAWGLSLGEIQAYWTDQKKDDPGLKNWAILMGGGNLGFGVQHWDRTILENDQAVTQSLNDYTIALGFGDQADRFGIGYTWSKGDITEDMPRDNVLSFGSINRPCRFASIGMAGHWAMKQKDLRGIVDAGIRPFGTPLLTLFGDATMQSDQTLKDVLWSAGAAVEPVPGIKLFGKMFYGGAYTAGLTISMTGAAVTAMPHYDKDGNSTYTTYGVRAGVPTRDVFTGLTQKDKMFLRVNLTDKIKYQRYQLFDRGGHTLMELLETLDQAKNDPRIAGIAVKITENMSGSIELIWEVREKLKEIKASGKSVVVFLERGGQAQYYLASVADKIMVDPETTIPLMGFSLGRSYYRNMLDKLGVGVDEWRFFRFKSAAEGFSRTSMSEGDREQLQALADGWYETFRADICASRNITPEEFDHVVNEVSLLDADSLLFYKLVDDTGRWDKMDDLIKQVAGSKKKTMSEQAFKALQPQSDEWGNPPLIAVIYALGPCSMDDGINARRLEGVIKSARDSKRVKAVVFRADSPGGDILPSDIVAVELKKTAEKKPVIVTQGMVAGSGGYWISMFGDTIIASPWTITGSIGVIGLFLYNDGFNEKVGLSYDQVKVGKHADLGRGASLPIIGFGFPNRPLTEEEHSGMERRILKWYDEFVKKVAEGRGMDKDSVHAVAQGRIWTGTDGLRVGLVDELGGMDKAIAIAKAKAGIKPGRRVEISERPKPDLFDPSMLKPSLLGVKYPLFYQEPKAEDLIYLNLIRDAEGRPLAIIPLDLYMNGE